MEQNKTQGQGHQQVTQKRGPELREEMNSSQARGEDFRAEHQGADARKVPNDGNSKVSHKAEGKESHNRDK